MHHCLWRMHSSFGLRRYCLWHVFLGVANRCDACMQLLGACVIVCDSCVVLFIYHSIRTIFYQSSNSLLQFFFKMSCYIIKRKINLIYSTVKSPMKIQLWNTETFEHLQRSLIRWLDVDNTNGENIRRIKRLVTVYNNNGEHRIWESVKIDSECRIMMHSLKEIVLMVVIE